MSGRRGKNGFPPASRSMGGTAASPSSRSSAVASRRRASSRSLFSGPRAAYTTTSNALPPPYAAALIWSILYPISASKYGKSRRLTVFFVRQKNFLKKFAWKRGFLSFSLYTVIGWFIKQGRCEFLWRSPSGFWTSWLTAAILWTSSPPMCP